MSTVSPTNLALIRTWPVIDGSVHLYTGMDCGLVADAHENNRISQIRNEWIEGIPKEFRRSQSKLRKYLEGTYVRLISTPQGLILRIHHQMNGGMLGALGGLFSSVSSTMNFFTSSNYVKLAKTAGSETRATIRVGGIEARATIEKAEDSAKKTLGKMGAEVRSSIDRAQKGAQEVLQTASSEMIKTIEMAGVESRYTSKVMELQAEKIIGKASRETQLLLQSAGLESAQAILLCGEEARKTCLALSRETTANLQNARQETQAILSQGSIEVRDILDKAAQDVKAIIHTAGEQYSQKSAEIIKTAFSQADQIVSSTLFLAHEKASCIIDHLVKEARGILFDMGAMGQVLIKDTGQEIRLIADDILRKAFAGQEMIIQAAGEEARVTVQTIGYELRSTLYEIPSAAALFGENLGRNFVHGIKDSLFGIVEVQGLINDLKNMRGKQCNIYDLVNFVYEQHQLSPDDKHKLYNTLIAIFNHPAIEERERNTIMLFIGLAALQDKGLVSPYRYYLIRGTDFRNSVISRIPGEAGKRLLEEGKNAIHYLLPKRVEESVVPAIVINPYQLEIEKQALKIREQENALLDTQTENRLLLAVSQEEKKMANTHAKKVASFERTVEELNKKLEELATVVQRQQKEIQFLSDPLSGAD